MSRLRKSDARGLLDKIAEQEDLARPELGPVVLGALELLSGVAQARCNRRAVGLISVHLEDDLVHDTRIEVLGNGKSGEAIAGAEAVEPGNGPGLRSAVDCDGHLCAIRTHQVVQSGERSAKPERELATGFRRFRDRCRYLRSLPGFLRRGPEETSFETILASSRASQDRR